MLGMRFDLVVQNVSQNRSIQKFSCVFEKLMIEKGLYVNFNDFTTYLQNII